MGLAQQVGRQQVFQPSPSTSPRRHAHAGLGLAVDVEGQAGEERVVVQRIGRAASRGRCGSATAGWPCRRWRRRDRRGRRRRSRRCSPPARWRGTARPAGGLRDVDEAMPRRHVALEAVGRRPVGQRDRSSRLAGAARQVLGCSSWRRRSCRRRDRASRRRRGRRSRRARSSPDRPTPASTVVTSTKVPSPSLRHSWLAPKLVT